MDCFFKFMVPCTLWIAVTIGSYYTLKAVYCLFISFPGVTTQCGCIFHSPVAGFSLLVFEVSWSTQRRATVGRTPLDKRSIRRRDLLRRATVGRTPLDERSIHRRDLLRRATVGRTPLDERSIRRRDLLRRATVGRTPLDERSVRRRDHYLTTQHSQQTNIHAPGGIGTHNLSWRAAEDLHLRPRGRWDRQKPFIRLNKMTERRVPWTCSSHQICTLPYCAPDMISTATVSFF
jgi:hypothetical protein